MKLVLKGADYSENGIATPYEFANIVDGISIDTAHGTPGMPNPNRSYYSDFVPIKFNELLNKGVEVGVFVYFFSAADENTYIGKRGTTLYTSETIAANGTLDILSGNDFVDGSETPVSVSSAKYYRISFMSSAEGIEFEAQKSE